MKNMHTNIILPPNKQMDVHFLFSEYPVIYNHLLFLDFNSNGNFLLGSADLYGTFWEGNVLYFDNVDDLIDLKFSKFYTHNTATDGKFISNDIIAVAEDTGILNLLSIDDNATLKPQNYFRHSMQISELAVWSNSSNVVSCFGRNIAVWDTNSSNKKPLALFDNVHTDIVNSIDTLKSNKNIIISASSDRKACLWDIREENPQFVLYSNEFSSLSKLIFDPNDDNLIAVACEAGYIYIVDKRQPGEFLSMSYCFDKPVNSLAFNESHQLGVAGAMNEVLVFDINGGQSSEIYRNTEHKSIVKDLKWFKNQLISCGFGEKQIIKHSIINA